MKLSKVGLMDEPLSVGERVLFNPDPNFSHRRYRDLAGKVFTVSNIGRPERSSNCFGDLQVFGNVRLLYLEEFEGGATGVYDARFLRATKDYKIDQEPLEDEEVI